MLLVPDFDFVASYWLGSLIRLELRESAYLLITYLPSYALIIYRFPHHSLE